MKQHEISKAELYSLAVFGLAKGIVIEGVYDAKRYIENHRQAKKAVLGKTAIFLSDSLSNKSENLVWPVLDDFNKPTRSSQDGLENVVEVVLGSEKADDQPIAA